VNAPRLTAIEAELARATSGLTTFPCAVLRNITIEGVEPYLRYAGRGDGLDVQLHWGDFDNILQEASGNASGVIGQDPKAIIVCLWLPAFSNLFGASFPRATLSEVLEEQERILGYCTATLRALRQKTTAPILWLQFEPPAIPSGDISSINGHDRHRAAISALNTALAEDLAAAGNAWLVDLGACVERTGVAAFYDWRYWHLARAPFSRTGMAQVAFELAKYVRALSGRTRKCLVLDCDNTLWGGVVGEDGVDGVAIGPQHPGSAYREFQHEILNLHHRGVLLALCSKNNEQDVLEVLRSRDEMLLREEHFAHICVNWNDKASNLRQIASDLNIGLDSLVFVDDSEFEIDLIRTTLPEVQTLLVPPRAAESRALLAGCGWFDTLTTTEEDRHRSQMYRAEASRRTAQAQFTDLREYLQSLQMTVIVRQAADADLDRAAQLCQRTNQFNLTSRRYTRDELAAVVVDPARLLLLLKLSDRFGDYGTVGLCVLITNGDEAVFDTFLLSCRVLGRGVETAFLTLCAQAAVRTGATRLIGRYIETSKNGQVADFYPRHGFTVTDRAPGERHFALPWNPTVMTVPDHFLIRAADSV
jgi:FkbH-like protein